MAFQWQLSKRLEKGRFVWPSAKDGKIALTPAQLAMLLEGEEDQETVKGNRKQSGGLVSPEPGWFPRRKTGGCRCGPGGL